MIALVAGSLFAASGDDFYDSLYRRGVSHFNDGKYDAARRELQIAAFGSIESIPRYETAHAYLIAAARQLQLNGDARLSLQRLLNAEKVERHYASLPIPAPVRQLVDSAARALLTKEEAASLREGAEAVQAAAMESAPAPQASGSTTTAPPAPTSSITAPNDAMTIPAPSAPPTSQPAAPPASSSPQSSVTPTPAVPAPTVAKPMSLQAPMSPPESAASSGPSSSMSTEPTTSAAPTTLTVTTPTVSAPRAPTSTLPPQPAASATAPRAGAPSNKPSTPRPSTTSDGWKMPASSPTDISAQFRVADDAIARGDLAGARIAYRSVLASDNLSHANALRVAEGLYRARDFSGVVSAFTRAGTISRGEEPYRYYLAVALYETGQYAAAKRELMAVIPFIEVTADVARYDAKIRAAIE
jgi:hypothetical protein